MRFLVLGSWLFLLSEFFVFTPSKRKSRAELQRSARRRRNWGGTLASAPRGSVEWLSEAAESHEDQVNENDGLAMTCQQHWDRG
jgi:hypothetical protein